MSIIPSITNFKKCRGIGVNRYLWVNAKKNNKTMINAGQKGKRFELKVAKLLNEKFDTSVRRTPNSGGLSIKGDIIDTSGCLSDFHFECKNQEKLNIWKALEQSRSDSGSRISLVVFTKNNELDYVALEFNDWMDLVKEMQDWKNKAND